VGLQRVVRLLLRVDVDAEREAGRDVDGVSHQDGLQVEHLAAVCRVSEPLQQAFGHPHEGRENSA
jgi:hypothetical protein